MAKRRDSKSCPGGSSPSAPVLETMNIFKKAIDFLKEVKIELGNVSWSSRQELVGATFVVIIIMSLVALFIGLIDIFLSKILSVVFR